tara:strand:+ start:1371 stop:1769 length:399 start_codon:yes stop_codon:yes gene_type:complete
MALKEVLVNALRPHRDEINTWSPSDVEMLFMGFGNFSLYWKGDLPIESESLTGTFKENAVAVVEALNELDLNKGNWTPSDIYWTISANAGEVREDLVMAIQNAGFDCYDYYCAEDEIEAQPIRTYQSEPSIY